MYCIECGKELERKTTVEISENNNVLTFTFTCENCKFYCPYEGIYNEIHSRGDICEILIGTDPNRNFYYEIELSPNNDLMLAKMQYKGEDENGPILGIDFVEKPFVKMQAIKTQNGYTVTAIFNKNDINTGEGDIYFNAYRIDTDGGKYVKNEQLLYALNPTMRGKFHTPNKFLWLKNYVK